MKSGFLFCHSYVGSQSVDVYQLINEAWGFINPYIVI